MPYTHEFDSELMQHYSPMVQHGPSRNLAAVYDENRNPLLFTIANDGQSTLAVTVADRTTGKHDTFDLSKAFGITQPITYIAATQDEGQNIFLAFATRAARDTNIFVCAPTTPEAWRHPETIKTHLIPEAMTTVLQDIRDLFFVPNVKIFREPLGYPFLAVEYYLPYDPYLKRDLRLERIVYSRSQWTLQRDDTMVLAPSREHESFYPVNYLDKAVFVLHQKYIVTASLYMDGGSFWGQLGLWYYNLATGVTSAATMTFRPDTVEAQKLATCVNSGDYGSNDLLIAGNGLWFYGTQTLLDIGEKKTQLMPTLLRRTDGNNKGKPDNFFRNVEDMITAQSGSEVSIFIRTSESTICNLMIDAGDVPRLKNPTVPILAGDVRDFSPIFHSGSQKHHFMVLNNEGQHFVLQFKHANSVWEEQSFLINPSAAKVDEPAMTSTVSYQTHILIKDSDTQLPYVSSKVLLSASDTVNATVNGNQVTLGPTAGVSVQTDLKGYLSVVSAVDSLGSSSVFSIQIDGKAVSGGPIDPAVNINKRLANVNSGDELRKAKAGDGSNLLTNSNLSDDAVDAVGTALGQLHSQLNSVNQNGSFRAASIFSEGWAAWHFIEASEKAVVDEFKKVGEKIVSMVVKIGDDIFELAVDSVSRALKAISYVLNQIKVDLQRIADWIGMMFVWKDIEKTKDDMVDTIKAFFGQCKTWTPIIVDGMETALQTGVDTLDHMLAQMSIDSLVGGQSAGGLSGIVKDGATHQTSKPADVMPEGGKTAFGTSNTSPSAQWSNNHALGGNIISNPSSTSAASAAYSFDQPGVQIRSPGQGILTIVHKSRLHQFTVRFPRSQSHKRVDSMARLSPAQLDDIEDLFLKLEGILKDAENSLLAMGEDLYDIIKGGFEKIGVKLINLFSTFVRSLLKVLQQAIDAVLDVVKKIFGSMIDTLLDEGIEIPFIEAIWKFFTGGKDLPNMFEISCVLFAIPTTLMAKLIVPKGQSFWPDLTNWANGANFRGMDTSSLDIDKFFGTIKQWIEGGAKMTSTSAPPRTKKYRRGAPSTEDWTNWSKGEIWAHPIITAFEAVVDLLDGLAAKADPNHAIRRSETLVLIVEACALAFSFPNLNGYTQNSDSANMAKAFEITSFSLRSVEVIISLVLWIVKKANPGNVDRLKACDAADKIASGILSVLEFAVSIVASAIVLNSTSGVQKTAAGLAIGNACSSVLEHLCVQLASYEKFSEIQPYLFFGAAICTVVDVGLDAGRGGFEWLSPEPAKQINIAALNSDDNDESGEHEIVFTPSINGERAVLIMGDFTGTHQVVSY